MDSGPPPDAGEEPPSQPRRRRGRPRRTDADFTPRDRSASSTRSRSTSSRRTRQRVDPSDTPASLFGGSIRDSARIQSISTGSQQSASSSGSFFNIEYHRRRNAAGIGNSNTNNDNDVIMQANLPSQHPTSPIQATRLDQPATCDANPRTCICLDKTFPKGCPECSPGTQTPCAKHVLIKCANQTCIKQFHKNCIASLQYIDIHDEVALSGYMCMECKCQQDLDTEDAVAGLPFSQLTGQEGHREKLLRLGLFPKEVRDQNTTRAEENLINSMIRDMKKCMTDEEVSSILDSRPRAYPTAVKMSDEAIDKHVRWGRRFEISMRLYKVHQCDCCGRTQPGHMDSNFCNDPKNDPPPFEQKHLTTKYIPVWRCNCWGFCKGTQFYSQQKPTHTRVFKENHQGQTPSQFLGTQQPNAILCDKCYKNEISAEQVNDGGVYNLYFLHISFIESLLAFLYSQSVWPHPLTS